MQFLNWLWTRKEKEIAVLTHNDFLKELGSKYHPCKKRSANTLQIVSSGQW
ncbi:hypothetical protein ACHQM5_000543 [Ranunculus cassubicifolius]